MQSLLGIATGLLATLGGGPALQGERQALQLVVESDWMPVPAFVVDSVPLPNGNWKHNEGWAGRAVLVAHEIQDGALVIGIREDDGYAGAPVRFRLERSRTGAVSVVASGGTHSCVAHGRFFDLHGEVRLERRGAFDPALRLSFRLDAIDDGLSDPLRTEGAVEIPLMPGEWDVEIAPPSSGIAAGPTAREVWWRWADGTLRAHGWVDQDGRRRDTWVTWSRDGCEQSRSQFVAGERHGPLRTMDEHCIGMGLVEHGVKEGEWSYEVHAGGRWTERYVHGDLVQQATAR